MYNTKRRSLLLDMFSVIFIVGVNMDINNCEHCASAAIIYYRFIVRFPIGLGSRSGLIDLIYSLQCVFVVVCMNLLLLCCW